MSATLTVAWVHCPELMDFAENHYGRGECAVLPPVFPLATAFTVPCTENRRRSDRGDKSSRQTPPCHPLSEICRVGRWMAHGMCLLL